MKEKASLHGLSLDELTKTELEQLRKEIEEGDSRVDSVLDSINIYERNSIWLDNK